MKMSITHYKGKKIPIVLVPNSIEISPELLYKDKSIDFTSYQSLLSILYPDALFFYDEVNSNFNKNSHHNLDDLFYSIASIDFNKQTLRSLINNMSEKALRYNNERAKEMMDTLFGKYLSKYSMLELMFIMSKNFNCMWQRDAFVVIADDFDLSSDMDKFLQTGSLNRIPDNSIENFKRLWCALREQISYKDLVSSSLIDYLIKINN